MPQVTETLDIRTHGEKGIVNITGQVNDVVKKAKISDGTLLVFTPHTTTALTINEDEPGLQGDILGKLGDIVPRGEGYSHDKIDSNAHSHILASIIGCSVSIPIVKGRPVLGTWQSILFIELDGPRNRRVTVQIR
jgi:secondary thiamine-phosphate synthase enzyme